ncbi:MAG TPA: hypothetical protein VH985_16915 [Candidatus Binatia bacterium]|jgi:hypothetical protein
MNSWLATGGFAFQVTTGDPASLTSQIAMPKSPLRLSFSTTTSPLRNRRLSVGSQRYYRRVGEERSFGFEILYVFKGVVHKYRPDFIIRLKTGDYLVLETKGQDTDQDKAKRTFLDEWVKAVNEHGGFGKWRWAVSKQPGDVVGILTGAGHKL